jgi:hypothetical protein
MLNRRETFLGGVAAIWAVPVVTSAQAAQAVLTWNPRALSLEEARTLAAASERIIPATSTPGAIGVGVPQFIDRALADWCEADDVQRLKLGLRDLGAGFAALPAAEQDVRLRQAEAEARTLATQRPPKPHWFLTLRELTTVGYFTSQTGATKVLRYDPVPGEYRGCVPVKEIGVAWATS